MLDSSIVDGYILMMFSYETGIGFLDAYQQWLLDNPHIPPGCLHFGGARLVV